jgi:hypothetical protein
MTNYEDNKFSVFKTVLSVVLYNYATMSFDKKNLRV